jgi:hypothetical protein
VDVAQRLQQCGAFDRDLHTTVTLRLRLPPPQESTSAIYRQA